MNKIKSPAYHIGRATGKLEILIKNAESLDSSADNVVLSELKELNEIHEDIFNSLAPEVELLSQHNGIDIAGVWHTFIPDELTDCPDKCSLKDVCREKDGSPCFVFGKGHFEIFNSGKK